MTMYLLTAPPSEPVTTGDAKAAPRIDDARFEALIWAP